MLVLSRNAGEKIVFPAIAVTVEVIRIQGNAAKIGITAPPSLKILREELNVKQNITLRPFSEKEAAPSLSAHRLNNHLNRLNLAMHLFQKQRDAGLFQEAEETLGILFAGLENLDKECAPAEPILPAKTPSARRRTLLVEDDANERMLLAGILNMNGWECVTAADGQEALDYLNQNEQPDVVLLDMHMPRCDGPNTLRAIRGEPKLANMRIFSVSGTAPRDLGIHTGPGGIDGWFPKPLNPRTLWEDLQKSLTTAN